MTNHCTCDTRETHPISECVAPWETPEDVQQRDVQDLLLALGLSSHARPYSPHAVIHREILPALRRVIHQCHADIDYYGQSDDPMAMGRVMGVREVLHVLGQGPKADPFDTPDPACTTCGRPMADR